MGAFTKYIGFDAFTEWSLDGTKISAPTDPKPPRSLTALRVMAHPHPRGIRQFCGGEIDVRCCTGTKTAHPEKTKRERHLRSSRTFQRDRPFTLRCRLLGKSLLRAHRRSPECRQSHTPVNPNRTRFQNMWVIRPRSRAPNTRIPLRSVAGGPSARCRYALLLEMSVIARDQVIGAGSEAHLVRRAAVV